MTQTKTSKSILQRTRGADYDDTPPKRVPKGARRRGRPEIELHPIIKARAVEMVLQGATMPEVAKEVGVSVPTLYQLFGRDEQFLNAVNEARAVFDQRVINSLAQRAVGYEQQVEKVFSNGTRATVTEHVVPDVGAAMIWLRNRQNWRSSDNVAQDAIDAASQVAADAPASTKTLAMAALALLTSAAAGTETPGGTIDVTPNAPRARDVDDSDEDEDEGEEALTYATDFDL